MISLLLTDDPARRDVCFSELGIVDKPELIKYPPAGYIELIGDSWFPYRDKQVCGEGHADPIEAAKLVFPNYEELAIGSLLKTIDTLEEKIRDEYDSPLTHLRQRILVGLKMKLALGEY